MRWYLVLGLLVILAACAQQEVVCSEPYIDVGGRCCLDADADGGCDARTENETKLDCSLCPPKFVTETVEVPVHKYVCMNGSIMDEASQCGERIVSNAHLFTVSREESDLVEEFDTRPACRGRYKAAEVHIQPAGKASRIVVQVMREPNTAYENLYELNASRSILDDEYVYIGFCERIDCESVTDAQLVPDKAYKIRADLTIDGERVFTRERLLDPTPDGEYSQQNC